MSKLVEDKTFALITSAFDGLPLHLMVSEEVVFF